MAQAKRTVRERRERPKRGLRVEGCYNLDTKIVVEWELDLGKNQIRDILCELPTGAHGYKVLRACLSASCFERYEDLADGIVTNFRLNRASTLSMIETGVALGILAPKESDEPGPDARIWARP